MRRSLPFFRWNREYIIEIIENYRKRKAKATLLNMDLIMLKTLLKDGTDTIKSFLTYSIQRKIQTANVFNSLEQSKF